MKLNYLFPHRYKKIGWMVLIPSAIIGLIVLINEYEPSFLDLRVPAIFIDELFGKAHFFGMVDNNILDEILGVLVLISSLLVSFSKQNIEDEFIAKLRLDSLVWATFVNYGILLIAIIFVYDLAFFWVMIFNMFTFLWFFIIRFNWQISRLKRTNRI